MTGTPSWNDEHMGPNETQPTLGLDLDGVVGDFETSFRSLAERLANRPLRTVDRAAFSLSDRFAIPASLVDEVFATGVASGELFGSVPPITDQINAVRHLHDAGWRIHVVTARPTAAKEATEWWLAEHAIPYDEITLTDSKHMVTGLTILADDLPLNVERHIEHHGQGAATLVDADWNRERSDLPRIESLMELADLVLCA